MIVEDEEFILGMYKLKFEQSGWEVVASETGAGVFELAKKEDPDIILLDILLPDMTGYDVLEKLKADAQTKNIPVIIASNLGQDEEIKKGVELGALDYITKSNITPSQLVEKIDSLINK